MFRYRWSLLASLTILLSLVSTVSVAANTLPTRAETASPDFGPAAMGLAEMRSISPGTSTMPFDLMSDSMTSSTPYERAQTTGGSAERSM